MRRSPVLVAAALVAATAVVACSDDASGVCDGAAYAALWSSESAKTTMVTYDADGEQLGSLDYDVLGLVPVKGLQPHGESHFGLATGNAQHTENHVVELTGCELTLHPIDEQLPLALAVTDDAFFTTNTVNATANVYRHGRADDGVTRVQFPGELGTQLEATSHGLAVVTANPETFVSTLHVLDPDTLEGRWSMELPVSMGLGPDSLVVGDDLYLASPIEAATDTANDQLARVNLAERTVHHASVGVDLPYRLREHDGAIYAAHTFMNPAFGDLDDLRTVSVIDPATLSATQHEAGVGVEQIELHDGHLYAYGEAADGMIRMEKWALPAFERVFATDLPYPDEQRYPAGLIVFGDQ